MSFDYVTNIGYKSLQYDNYTFPDFSKRLIMAISTAARICELRFIVNTQAATHHYLTEICADSQVQLARVRLTYRRQAGS